LKKKEPVEKGVLNMLVQPTISGEKFTKPKKFQEERGGAVQGLPGFCGGR